VTGAVGRRAKAQPRARLRRRAGLRLACAATLGLLLSLELAAPAALARSAWWDEAKIRVTVHDHVFHRVTVNAIGCSVRVRLHFDAPPSGYSESAPERNHYRFSAKVSLSEEQSFVSGPIANGEAGARVIAFSYDTTDQGCWAEREHTLRKVDVHACRGVGCVPEAFE
jgi:hypothetical protein